jgi:hypothetical protein
MTSWARLTPFEVGQIKAHAHHGLTPVQIVPLIKKSDKSNPSVQAVVNALAKLKLNPKWKGERENGSGRLRSTSAKVDQKVVSAVLEKRGKAKVTIPYLKRTFPELKDLTECVLRSRLHEAGFAKKRRRRKTLVGTAYQQPRIDYGNKIKYMHASTLERWAYTDGAAFYRSQTEAEHEHETRRSLGGWVWRKADGRDAMFKDCVGPSSYKKAQGLEGVWEIACWVQSFKGFLALLGPQL